MRRVAILPALAVAGALVVPAAQAQAAPSMKPCYGSGGAWLAREGVYEVVTVRGRSCGAATAIAGTWLYWPRGHHTRSLTTRPASYDLPGVRCRVGYERKFNRNGYYIERVTARCPAVRVLGTPFQLVRWVHVLKGTPDDPHPKKVAPVG